MGSDSEVQETDSEVQNEKGFSENETTAKIGMNANDLFIVAERVNRVVVSGVTVGHIDEIEKSLSGNDLVLEGRVNGGKSYLVEVRGSGGLRLPSGVVADLMGDGFELRFDSCDQVKFLVSGGQDFVRAGVVKVFGLNSSPDQEVLFWELRNSLLDWSRYSEEGGVVHQNGRSNCSFGEISYL
ncbi:hypothetical protein AVEN_32630-1 [Araneus ventricosus]|uniref:Uncharacterized protein n=1 Tax=Araneus ventricosus TaxID=182803 RepID=A0A4Y2C741_ARAVE|nr:hypothetical protein AVEN_32630-1 [Araneus ventricosus]